jgi:hypothetical protein
MSKYNYEEITNLISRVQAPVPGTPKSIQIKQQLNKLSNGQSLNIPSSNIIQLMNQEHYETNRFYILDIIKDHITATPEMITAITSCFKKIRIIKKLLIS